MKARVKKTGEVLKVADYAVIIMENCDSYGNPLEYKPEEVELIDDSPADSAKSIDWEQRRFDLVKAIAQGLCSNCEFEKDYERFRCCISWTEYYSKNAIKIAEAVLTEYRKGGEQ